MSKATIEQKQRARHLAQLVKTLEWGTEEQNDSMDELGRLAESLGLAIENYDPKATIEELADWCLAFVEAH